MQSESMIFAGVDVSSGRKPVTFAALDSELGVVFVQAWDISQFLSGLKEHKSICLAINVPSRKTELYKDVAEKIVQTGLTSYSRQNSSKQLLETNGQDCFHALIGRKPLPRRTLEGRLQRSAVLYEQGLQITDPVDVFEEITRYKLMHGILPLENIYSSKELDALVAAFMAWLAVNRPGQIVLKGELALPA